jgi:hypothetical protein
MGEPTAAYRLRKGRGFSRALDDSARGYPTEQPDAQHSRPRPKTPTGQKMDWIRWRIRIVHQPGAAAAAGIGWGVFAGLLQAMLGRLSMGNRHRIEHSTGMAHRLSMR